MYNIIKTNSVKIVQRKFIPMLYNNFTIIILLQLSRKLIGEYHKNETLRSLWYT